MPTALHLYMDDSGTRNPDRKIGRSAAHNHDWFALGGYLVHQDEEALTRELHDNFCKRWNITYPLRSSNIRSKSDNFHWVQALPRDEQLKFYEDLYQFLKGAPVTGIACTIDRPGYNHRYREKYGRQRWDLCKTAFAIAVERSAKQARRLGYKLRVYVERGDKDADRTVEAYYKELRTVGMPFGGDTSGQYAPLTAAQLADTLYDFKIKYKSSPMMQLADLYLWPMAIGGYDPANRAYARLKADGKLIDCSLKEADIPHLGIKYSCFDLVKPNPQIRKDPDESGSSAATKG